jgi:hypothetical protein
MEYPLDNKARRFSYTHYYMNLRNGEKHDRKWLAYLEDVDRIFFASVVRSSSLVLAGIRAP